MNWDERFEKTFFTPEEIKESDRRVAAIQKELDREDIILLLRACLVSRNSVGLCVVQPEIIHELLIYLERKKDDLK